MIHSDNGGRFHMRCPIGPLAKAGRDLCRETDPASRSLPLRRDQQSSTANGRLSFGNQRGAAAGPLAYARVDIDAVAFICKG